MIKHSVQTHLIVSTEGHFEVLVGVMSISICEWTTTLIFLDHELVHHFDGTGINATTALVLLKMLNCPTVNCVCFYGVHYIYSYHSCVRFPHSEKGQTGIVLVILRLEFGRYSVQISAGTLHTLADIFQTFPQHPTANSRIVFITWLPLSKWEGGGPPWSESASKLAPFQILSDSANTIAWIMTAPLNKSQRTTCNIQHIKLHHDYKFLFIMPNGHFEILKYSLNTNYVCCLMAHFSLISVISISLIQLW